MEEKIILEIKIPRENEYPTEVAAGFFSSLSRSLKTPGFLGKIKREKPQNLVLEIACFGQQIRFYAIFEPEFLPFFESQILAAWPLAVLSKTPDYLTSWQNQNIFSGQLIQTNSFYYPLKTYQDFKDIDPLSSVLAVMSKAGPEDFLMIQFVLQGAPKNWQKRALAAVERGIKISQTERQPLPAENLIKQKASEVGLRAGIRLVASSSAGLNSLVGAFAAFSRGDGNALGFKAPNILLKNKFRQAIFRRTADFIPPWQIFSSSELATLWHLPNQNIKIPNIAWGRAVLSEAPENLPVALNLTEEQKREINFFAKTEFKNRLLTFGIKTPDRRRHIYIIGKTGTGKSTLIANMAIDDMKKRRGLAVIDPHGDLSEILLDYVPSYRINDVCYLDPADREHPFALNIMEVKNPTQAELVASGIISIFYKLYSWTWGPRLEHVLRNTLLTLAQVPNATLVEIPRILTDKKFRQKVVGQIKDPVLLNFWQKEFEKMPPNLQQEAISPILNKVGQFVTSSLIREIILASPV